MHFKDISRKITNWIHFVVVYRNCWTVYLVTNKNAIYLDYYLVYVIGHSNVESVFPR